MNGVTRKTAINIVGDIPWGTHLCVFYQTKKDLIEILVPYFRAGLEDNEYCMWIASEPLNVEDAKQALKKEVKNLDDYIKKSQIEILDHRQWYTKTGYFDADKVLSGWIEKEKQALEKGFQGLRLTGNTFWLEEEDWDIFRNYEATVNSIIGKHRMLAICAYPLDKCGASEIIDVVNNHEFALIKKEGCEWKIIETAEHKKTSEELKASEARYRAIVQDQTELICRFLPDKTLTFVNGAYCRYFGKESQQLIGHKFLPLIPEADKEKIQKHFSSFTPQNPVAVIFHRVITPEGKIRWQEWSNRAIFDEEGNLLEFQSVGRDITKRKQAEDALKLHEIRLQALLDLNRKAEVSQQEIMDFVREEILKVTLSKLSFTGLMNEDESVMTVDNWSKETMAQCAVADSPMHFPIKEAGLWGETIRQRKPIIINDYNACDYNKKGYPQGHVAIKRFLGVPVFDGERIVAVAAVANKEEDYNRADVRALTSMMNNMWRLIQRKRGEKALLESEEKFRTLFEQAAVGVAQIETKTGRFLRINRKYCDIVGYSVEELRSRSVQEIIHPDDLQADQDNMKKLIKGDIPDFVMEKRYLHKKGKIVWVNLTVSRMWGAGQEPNHHIAVIEDITERKNEEERRRLAGRILGCLNRETAGLEVIRDVLGLVKESTGFSAIGIRLNEGNDFPYFETSGFSEDFLKAENYLCAQDKDGLPIYDKQGNPLLECMCGNVLSGRTNPELPFFTERGSFWTNCTTELLASTSTEDLQGRTRNRCNQEGYESVALIPLRSGNEIVGLLQLNDTQEGRFSGEIIRFFEEIGNSIGIGLARIEAEQDLENVAKFPWENPNPVLRISQDGTLLYANPTAYPIIEEWGCRPGRAVPDLWHKTTTEVLSNDRHKRIEHRHDDKIFAFLVVPFAGSGYVNLYGRDITERKRAEVALKQSEERYALAQRAANIGSWDWNIVTGDLIWSDQVEPMFGFIKGKFQGTYEAFLDCVHPDDRQFVIDSVNACVEEGKDYAIEHRIIWPDGTVRWVSETGDVIRDNENKAIRMLGIVQDITERIEAERQIEILARFPSENPNPVLRIDKNGTVLQANAAGSKLLTESGTEPGSGAPGRWNQYIIQALESGSSKELEVSCAGRILSLIIVPVTGAGYINLYGSDITERKAAEEDLRKHRQHLKELVERRTAELREANKQLMTEIEGRKQLEREILDIGERERRRLGDELHDSLGQQLTGIAFMTKVLERKLAETSPNEVANVVEISKLVEQATNQTRGLARGLHPLDVGADSLMSSLEELARQTTELIGVRCFFKCEESVMIDDAAAGVHLYRIAQEAITNAIKHGKAKNIEIALGCKKDTSIMTIRNDGLAFPKEYEARGTGMGLQIMDHRVDLIGGSLDVHADDGGGTILTCSFPNKKNQG